MSGGSENVVVCGLGHVGYRVTRLLLRLGVRVIALGLDVRTDRARAITEAGGQVHVADARDTVELTRAGLETARALVATTDSDLVNVEVALDARRVRQDLRLSLRLFDRELARSLEQSLGRARAVGVSALSAPVMAFGALGQEVTAGFPVEDHEVLVGRVIIGNGSPLVGLTPRDLRERHGVGVIEADGEMLRAGSHVTLVAERARFAALPSGRPDAPKPEAERAPSFGKTLMTAWSNSPSALRRVFWALVVLNLLSLLVFRLTFDPPITLVEALYFTVTTVTTTGYGDITPRTSGPAMMIYGALFMLLGSVTMAVLYSFATSFVVSEQLRRELGRPPIPRGGHVVVVGLGNVGYRTWGELRRSEREVVAVDIDAEGEFTSALRGTRPFVTGDGRLTATLRQAGVETAAAVVASTADDAANLGIVLTARRLNPKIRTVARVFDADFASKLEQDKLVDLAISTSRVAAPTFSAAALFDHAAVGVEDEHGLTALCFGPLPAGWAGRSPADLGEEVPLVELDGELVAWDPNEPLPERSKALWARRRAYAI